MPTFAWILFAVGGFLLFFIVLSVLLKRFGGYAPGWRIRCAACGHVRPAAEAGIVRVAAAGTKHTLGYCQQCRKLGRMVIERDPGQVESPESAPLAKS